MIFQNSLPTRLYNRASNTFCSIFLSKKYIVYMNVDNSFLYPKLWGKHVYANRADRMSKVNVLTVHIILALCHPVCVFFSCLLQRSHFSTMAQSSKVYDGIPHVGKRVRKVITFMTRIRIWSVSHFWASHKNYSKQTTKKDLLLISQFKVYLVGKSGVKWFLAKSHQFQYTSRSTKNSE